MTLTDLKAQRAARLESVRSLKQSQAGMTGREISERLGLSMGTVHDYLIQLGLRTRLTKAKREERRLAVRRCRDEHPTWSHAAMAKALGLSNGMIDRDCPAPERRRRLGYADERILAAYNELERSYVVTTTTLAKAAGTGYATARSWLLRNHPESLVNFRRVKAVVHQFARVTPDGERQTIKTYRRSFPKARPPHPSKPKLSAEQRAARRAKARELAESGLSKQAIADKIGCCVATVIRDLAGQ